MNCNQYLEHYDLLCDAEAGREKLDSTLLQELREHGRDCATCREAVAENRALAQALAELPVFEAPVVSIRSHRRWLAPLLSAAAALLMTTLILWFFHMPVPEGLQVQRQGKWQSAAGKACLPGDRLYALRSLRVALSADVAVQLEPETAVLFKSPGEVQLESGRLTAWVRSGTPFIVKTKVATVEVHGTTFSVQMKNSGQPLIGKEFNVDAKTLLTSALVSVVVSVGTVSVYNSYGKVAVEPGQMAQISEASAPAVVEIAESLEQMVANLEETREEMAKIKTENAEQVQQFEERLASIAHSAATAASSHKEPEEEVVLDRAAQLQQISEVFDQLSKAGFAAYQHPKLTGIAEALRGMGEEGLEFVMAELSNEDGDKRFVAAALAEKLADPALIESLEIVALEDENFAVRRMSSHALAFMDHEDAGPALLKIVETETRDGGVRINAWYGLAQLKHPATARTFERVLNEAGGDIPADFVVDTALKVNNPDVQPALRNAYSNESVSKGMKLRILRTLGKTDNAENRAFVQKIADDPSTPEDLRSAAVEALAEN